jgi:hypothetical protein
MRIAEVSIPAHPVMKTFQTAPTKPDVGLLTDAGSVDFSTEGLGLQRLKSNESLLIGRAPDSADVRQS